MAGKWIDGWEEKLDALKIESGGHPSRDSGVCVMEAVAWLRSQEHTDHPICVSPVIGAFMRTWNDGLPSDAERNRLLKPLLPVIVDTVADDAVESRRSYMALDWLVRVHCPAFLGLTDALKAHAVALAGLAPITNKKSLDVAAPLIQAARSDASAAVDAAWAAAGVAAVAAARVAAVDAAWDAAGVAAVDAARVAAGVAAVAAARVAAGVAAVAAAGVAAVDAAWDAAGAAAGVAAVDAAWDAAGAAARVAAWDALKPTVTALQESASALVRKMAAEK